MGKKCSVETMEMRLTHSSLSLRMLWIVRNISII